MSHSKKYIKEIFALYVLFWIAITSRYPYGKNIFEEEWDNLIIIDACRQDFWKDETGIEGSRISKGSSTEEYIDKNFSSGDFSNYIYVTANPQFSDIRFQEITGRLPDNVFHTVFRTFNTDWDEDANTVLPKSTVRDAKSAKKLFPKKNW
jgi:hypothetical protein